MIQITLSTASEVQELAQTEAGALRASFWEDTAKWKCPRLGFHHGRMGCTLS